MPTAELVGNAVQPEDFTSSPELSRKIGRVNIQEGVRECLSFVQGILGDTAGRDEGEHAGGIAAKTWMEGV